MLSDLRYAARRLRRSPGFTLVAVITLALGVGAETALVSIINVVTAHPGRATIPADTFVLRRTSPLPQTRIISVPSPRFLPIELFRALAQAPSGLLQAVGAADYGERAIVQTGRRADVLTVEPVTADYAAALGARAELGRWLSEDDDRSARPVAVVSHRLWQRWFGGRAAITNGASIRVNRTLMSVMGVMPDGFDDEQVDLWIPFSDALVLTVPVPDADRARADAMRKSVAIAVRTAPGVPSARLDRLINDAVASGGGFGDARLTVQARRLIDTLPTTALDRVRPWMLLLSSLILLGACANLANMIYARGLSRAAEVSVRLSLGAGPWRVLRIFLAESALLALGATALGAVLAAVSLRLFGAAVPAIATGVRRAAVDFTPDARVFAIALSAGALGAIAIGWLTGWRAVRGSNARTLAASGHINDMTPRDGRARTALVAIQITAAVVLVIVAGLYLQNGPTVPDRKLGFDTTHVVTGRIVMDPRLDNATRRDVFADRLLSDARKLPGVEGAAVAASIPAGGPGAPPSLVTLSADDGHGIANAHPKRVTGMYSAVSPGFFAATGLRLLRGRDFGPSDAAGQSSVIILSRSAAEQLWPGENPIGKTMAFNRGLSPMVIGVSEDPIVEDSDSPLTQAANYCFVPLAQRADIVVSPTRFLVFRSAAPEAAIDAMQAAVHAIDEDIALVDMAPLDQTMFESYAPQRAVRLLMGVVSALALSIALLGVYGVITYFVTARTREFGIRIALGATPRAIIRLVIDHAIHIVLVGLLVGVFVASVTTRVVEHEVFRTMPNGLATWIVVPLLVLVTGVAAGFLPARRAAAPDPNVSLRE